jgi:ACT domain-containing protein
VGVIAFHLRISLPDRPGALGLVASRIGAVGGDIIAIDILDRDGGRAVDEFVVELADEAHIGLLTAEILEVDGALIEEIQQITEHGARKD